MCGQIRILGDYKEPAQTLRQFVAHSPQPAAGFEIGSLESLSAFDANVQKLDAKVQ
jgi:hypothetical protein